MESQKLMNWLFCLHYNYLDDDVGLALKELDPNDPSDRDRIIHLVFDCEFEGASDLTLRHMRESLDEVGFYPEHEVKAMLEEIGDPFKESLYDYLGFFRRIREIYYS